MRTRKTTWLVLGLLAACDASGARPAGPEAEPGPSPGGPGGSGGGAGSGPDTGAEGPAFAVSAKPELQWKRAHAFEADLSAALGLPADQLCSEFGTEPCIRSVHISPLGGHDPFASGLLEPSSEPLATTPTAYERIVLTACTRRALLERDGKAPGELFAGLALGGALDAASDAPRAVATRLYQRFLARDPLTAELEALATLARDGDGEPVSALAFAQAVCFAVGTSSEFIFF